MYKLEDTKRDILDSTTSKAYKKAKHTRTMYKLDDTKQDMINSIHMTFKLNYIK